MTDTTTTTTTPAASAGWGASLASITKWPQVAALAISALAALWYFDKLPALPSHDTTMQTMIDGHSVTITDLENRVATIEATAAAKSDIAEITARLLVLEKPKAAAPVTTGSISKKK